MPKTITEKSPLYHDYFTLILIHFFAFICIAYYVAYYALILKSNFMAISDFVTCLLIVINCYGIKKSLPYQFATNLILAICLLCLINVCICTGAEKSPLLNWIVAIPLTSCFLLSLRGSLIWLLLCCASFWLIQFMSFSFYDDKIITLSQIDINTLYIS